MTEDVDYPRDIRIDEKHRDEYDKFVNRSSSPFKGIEKSDLYVLAAALGWYEQRPAVTQDRYVLFNRNSLSDEQLWIMKSIAISRHEDVEILQNGRETLRYAEHYANGGMNLLVELRDGPDNLIREVTSRMVKATNELQSAEY